MTAAVGFTTVGRLWLIPGPLLLTGAVSAMDSWWEVVRSASTHWTRLVLAALGVFQLLMAATAAPTQRAVGAAGGLALITAAVTDGRHRRVILALVVVGTVPFALVAWSAIVPLLVLLLCAVTLQRMRHTSASPTPRGGTHDYAV